MSDCRGPGEPSGSRADGHLAAVVCLGAYLLAGTALPGAMSSGPPFSVLGVREAAPERGDEARQVHGRRPAPEPGLAGGYAARPDAVREPASPTTLNVNRADVQTLQGLPGVGPALARRIVAYRETHGPFRTPADLLQVSGVGAKRYARLQGMIHAAEAP